MSPGTAVALVRKVGFGNGQLDVRAFVMRVQRRGRLAGFAGGDGSQALVASIAIEAGYPHWHEFAAESFEVRSHGGTAFAGVDGEALVLPPPMVFRIHPGGLRVLVAAANLAISERRCARRRRPAPSLHRPVQARAAPPPSSSALEAAFEARAVRRVRRER